MTMLRPIPRSTHASKLREFADIVTADLGGQKDQKPFPHHRQWPAFFRRRIGPAFDGRIILEIGCADAAYLSRIASKYPRSAFIGLDWKFKAIYDAARRVSELGLNNIALLRGRGQDISRYFAKGEVDEIWVFHPDPCDRDVELPNRLIGPAFLGDVHDILRDGSSILALKTDHAGYYQWVQGLFEHSPRYGFEVAMSSSNYWSDAAALTHTAGRCFAGEATVFESRFIKKKLPIYYFEIQKSSIT